jgi:predicted Zn-dependent protease
MNNQGTQETVFDAKRAQAFLDENRFGDAVGMAEARLVRVPDDVEATIILSQGLLRMGKLDRLRDLLKEIDEKIGRLSLVYLRLGELCRKSGLNAEADNFLSKYNALLSTILPDEKRPQADVFAAGGMDGATEGENADDIYPEFYTVTLADLYIRQGHPALARNVLTAILEKEPGNELAFMKLTEVDQLLTMDGAGPGSATVRPALAGANAAVVSELERWLTQVIRMRSAAS